MPLYNSGRAKELHPLKGRGQRPPKAKGEYRILDEVTKKPVYIGVTNNLDRRMHEHIHSGKISGKNSIFAYKVANGAATQQALNDHERMKIKKHSPALNKRAGGAGRPYKSEKG